tara:strand:+ start:196 stop:381 length:186 start_codon:yes stop_codon:yes gene_type:complete
MYKVHWIIDGIAEVKLKDQAKAEEEIKKKLEHFVKKNKKFFDSIGAKAIQGKAYLPGKDEK